LNLQTSDSTSYPRHSPITARQRSALHPCQGGGPGARRLPGHVFWAPGWPHPLPMPVLIDRSADGYRAQAVGIPDGVCGCAPVPQARPQSGEDLPTGRLGDVDATIRWRAGPGCRVPVMAEPGIRTPEYPARIVVGAMDQDLDMEAAN
jgi:hypothetical protein